MNTLKLVFILLLSFSAISGKTANFTVNTTDDLVDLIPGDGVCETTINNNDCTLRAAIMETNALPSSDSISMPAGVFVLDLVGVDDFAMVGDLDVTSSELIIQGVSREQTIIDGNGTDRIFEFNDSDITLQSLTLQNGGDSLATVLGGAIKASGHNSDELNLINVKFENNRANAGGALFLGLEIIAILEDTIITNNTTVPLGITNAIGPAIFCSKCDIAINSSTISFNHMGGKSLTIEQGFLEMLNTTVSHNDEGGIRTTNASALIKFSSFVENNFQDISHFSFDDTHVFQIGYSALQNSMHNNCQAGDLPVSLGYNILSDSSCNFLTAGDMENTDAQLGVLSNNGGSTFTHHPSEFSPLLNQVPIAGCLDIQGAALLTDQRGQPRPFGSLCDIGALEINDGIVFINGFEA